MRVRCVKVEVTKLFGPTDELDVVVGKTYQRRADKRAEREGLVRVVDESGEDYLYPMAWFETVEKEKE